MNNITDPTLVTLRKRADVADAAWSAELQRVYGSRAGDARYDARGTATPTLRALSLAFQQAADAAYRRWELRAEVVNPTDPKVG